MAEFEELIASKSSSRALQPRSSYSLELAIYSTMPKTGPFTQEPGQDLVTVAEQSAKEAEKASQSATKFDSSPPPNSSFPKLTLPSTITATTLEEQQMLEIWLDSLETSRPSPPLPANLLIRIDSPAANQPVRAPTPPGFLPIARVKAAEKAKEQAETQLAGPANGPELCAGWLHSLHSLLPSLANLDGEVRERLEDQLPDIIIGLYNLQIEYDEAAVSLGSPAETGVVGGDGARVLRSLAIVGTEEGGSSGYLAAASAAINRIAASGKYGKPTKAKK